MTRYVFICSAGHSGSTLLDLLIGSHSQIASLGEISQLSKNIALNTLCSCGAALKSCEVWTDVLRRVGAKIGVDIVADPYALHMGYPLASTVVDKAHQTRRYRIQRQLVLGLQYLHLRYGVSIIEPLLRPVTRGIDNNVCVFEAVRSVLNAEAVVDSSKSYLKAVALYRRHPSRVRILLLTRDGRGVLWSNLKKGISRERALRHWNSTYTRAALLLRRHVPEEHRLQVRYEDLTMDTGGALQVICRFLGLPFEEGMLDFRRKKHHIVNGNRMRLSSSSAIKIDVEWKTRLPLEDLQFFEERAGTLNRALGYV